MEGFLEMKSVSLEPKAKAAIATAIQQVFADEYGDVASTYCAVYAWVGQRVIKEALGLDYKLTAGSLSLLDSEGESFGFLVEQGNYHAWLTRAMGHRTELVDFSSIHWPWLCEQTGYEIRSSGPPFIWMFQDELNPDWEWTDGGAFVEKFAIDGINELFAQPLVAKVLARLSTSG